MKKDDESECSVLQFRGALLLSFITAHVRLCGSALDFTVSEHEPTPMFFVRCVACEKSIAFALNHDDPLFADSTPVNADDLPF
jgi:hypothetical protein